HQQIVADYPAFGGIVRLLEHCTGLYGPALAGEIAAISVLYPDGTSDFMDQCYRAVPSYTGDGVYLDTVGRLLSTIAARPRTDKLRILEIGGGAAGLTRIAVEALRGHAVEYHFTDISQSFVRRAEVEAAARGIDFMQFGVLDITRDPQSQGYPLHGFDVV